MLNSYATSSSLIRSSSATSSSSVSGSSNAAAAAAPTTTNTTTAYLEITGLGLGSDATTNHKQMLYDLEEQSESHPNQQQQHELEQQQQHQEAVDKYGRTRASVMESLAAPRHIKIIGVNGVFEEIMVLLFRLESDRQHTEHKLLAVRNTQNEMRSSLEKMVMRRAVELPLQVQIEHDACITDITELNWHITYTTKAERRLQKKVEAEQRLFEQLRIQVDTLKSSVPFLKEKISDESEQAHKIAGVTDDLDEDLHKSEQRLEQSREKAEQFQLKANKEREIMQAEIDNHQRELNKAKYVLINNSQF